MEVSLYRDGTPAGTIELPEEVHKACLVLDRWLSEQPGDVTVYGLAHVAKRDRSLEELTVLLRRTRDIIAERDARIVSLKRTMKHALEMCWATDVTLPPSVLSDLRKQTK